MSGFLSAAGFSLLGPGTSRSRRLSLCLELSQKQEASDQRPETYNKSILQLILRTLPIGRRPLTF